MGYSTILDIIAGLLIGGIMLLTLNRINETAVSNQFYYNNDRIIQKNLVSLVEEVEYDFKKIGYCKDPMKFPDPSKAIRAADSTSIKFYTDVDNDGNIDSVRYYIGSTSELSSTPNPKDRLLYRVVNNETPYSSNLGITEFRLVYFDVFGDTIDFPILVPGEISFMEISVKLENPFAYDNNYAEAYWRQVRLAAKNLKNR